MLEAFRQLRETGDARLREELIEGHMHLVAPVVRGFSSRAEWQDLVQVGYLGLIKAVDHFDVERGLRFSTYAICCILGELRHYVRDYAALIRRPRWLTGLSQKVAGFIEHNLQSLHRLPTIAEIAARLNLSEAGVQEVLGFKPPISLDARRREDAADPLVGLACEEPGLPVEDRLVLLGALETLLEIERHIVYLFFYRDLNQSEIARRIGLEPRKVSRLMKRTLDKLREMLSSMDLSGVRQEPRVCCSIEG